VLMLTLPALLGGRRVSRAVNEPYECGIVPVGSTHFRMPIPFYLFAIFFVIFDLEVVFLFAWAVAVKETGWLGFTEALIFILILFAALIYLWRLGALDWRTQRQKLDLRNLDAR
jgi:NADH-quinone oxidoreductase subunit A